ncbi:DUF4102 domain-containing protein [Paracoccus suum]|uniref:DUF4102 domain-containing protein n=1 Tax=Paracoccus suum TaxID=2259340 RepID=A0A344PLY0_9RHOB|nr:integrase family protein [Paracoccus suum]AXC50385.1 DUF4102 domain-containing protein [Paracoccus suum]
MAVKLNQSIVLALPVPATGQTFTWDASVSGFGVRTSCGGSQAYIVQSRLNGRSRRVTIGPVSTMTVEQARKLAKVELAAMVQGRDRNAERAEAKSRTITLSGALDLYVTGRQLKDSTIKQARYHIAKYFGDWLGRELGLVSPAMLVARFDKITCENGPTVAAGACRYFRVIYAHAAAHTARPDGTPTLRMNPAARLSALKRWHRPSRKQGVVRPGEFPAFMATVLEMQASGLVDHRVFGRYVEMLVRTGLRRGEAVGLTWKDIDFDAGTLRVPEPKNYKPHTLPLTARIVELLVAQRADSKGQHVFWQPGPKGSVPDPRKSWAHLRAEAGLDIGAHDLRRTFASLADALDLSGFTLAKLLNHSTASGAGSVTAGYVISDHERLRGPMARIGAEIDRLSRPPCIPTNRDPS